MLGGGVGLRYGWSVSVCLRHSSFSLLSPYCQLGAWRHYPAVHLPPSVRIVLVPPLGEGPEGSKDHSCCENSMPSCCLGYRVQGERGRPGYCPHTKWVMAARSKPCPLALPSEQTLTAYFSETLDMPSLKLGVERQDVGGCSGFLSRPLHVCSFGACSLGHTGSSPAEVWWVWYQDCSAACSLSRLLLPPPTWPIAC